MTVITVASSPRKMFALLWGVLYAGTSSNCSTLRTAQSHESSVWTVQTLVGNGTQASIDGSQIHTAISEPWGVVVDASQAMVYWVEFGGARTKNLTRCDLGGYKCGTVNSNPQCMQAPGRTTRGVNNCDCGCDTFYYMSSGHRLRALSAREAAVHTVAGSYRGYVDGSASQAVFNHPYDVTLAPTKGEYDSGSASVVADLIIADALNHAIRWYHADTKTVETIVGGQGRGCKDEGGGLNFPTSVAVDPLNPDLVYIADRGNNCIRQWSISNRTLFTIAGDCCSGNYGHRDGPGASALFSGPCSIAARSVEVATQHSTSATHHVTELYVADAANNALRVITLDSTVGQYSAAQAVVKTVSVDPVATRVVDGVQLSLHMPMGVTTHPTNGDVFVSSNQGSQVFVYTAVHAAVATSFELVAGNGTAAFRDGSGPAAMFSTPNGLAWWADEGRGKLVVADQFNNRLRLLSPPVLYPSTPRDDRNTKSARATVSEHNQLHLAEPSLNPLPRAPLTVLVWTGHSGPYHDHFANGKILAQALNKSGMVAVLACDKDEDIPCELAFAAADLQTRFDAILIYADTYENPLRGSLSTREWAGLFEFIESGGGLFALHTASACWDHQFDDPTDPESSKFHREVLNCAFGGHSPYKDYIAKIVDRETDPITRGLSDYIVTDELYHPVVFNRSRSTVFITAYDRGQAPGSNATAVHGLRHTYGKGRVLYFAQGHDMAEFENVDDFTGNHVFQVVVKRCLQWVAKRL
eukprot:m.513737 g.513737  ORF g.513737 m.513737 type:complete len:753 (+) comp21907_c0_seq1:229-2487(+)